MNKNYQVAIIKSKTTDTTVYLRVGSPLGWDTISTLTLIIEAAFSNPFFIQRSEDPLDHNIPIFLLQ